MTGLLAALVGLVAVAAFMIGTACAALLLHTLAGRVREGHARGRRHARG